MSSFFKRNLVWFAIGSCIVGVLLSIIGIPNNQPIFFFIGILFALPSVAFIIYEVFFEKLKTEVTYKRLEKDLETKNITQIIDSRDNLKSFSAMNSVKEHDEHLEELYNGYASREEIERNISNFLEKEREKVVETAPSNVLSEPIIIKKIEPINQEEIAEVTTEELLRQRELETIKNAWETKKETVQDNDENFDFFNKPFEDTLPISKEIIATEPEKIITMPVPAKKKKPTPTNDNAKPKLTKAQQKKIILSQINLEHFLQYYFIEIASCFFINRNIFKDAKGIAPYNNIATNKETGFQEHCMSLTKGKLYKFCSYLADVERFLTHPVLYQDFMNFMDKDISLSRISEMLHITYRKNYKKDFVLNLSNREDWDNIIILVFNNYILDNNNFKDIFTYLPFEVPVAFNEENIIMYLSDPDLQERFIEKFPTFTEVGFPTLYEALYICFINSIKSKLSPVHLEQAILKGCKKITKALKRIANKNKKLSKAS